MQFKTTLFTLATAILATVGDCAPAPATANPSGAEAVGLVKRGTCGHSTFENRGSTASPTVSDCNKLRDSIKDSDSWTFTSFQPHYEIKSYGGCAFGLEWGQLFQGSVVVKGDDVRDIIRDSISKFTRSDGKVGARGVMPCGGQNTLIQWGLY